MGDFGSIWRTEQYLYGSNDRKYATFWFCEGQSGDIDEHREDF